MLDDATEQIRRRALLQSELTALIAQRDGFDRTVPGGAIALARLSAWISGRARELRDLNTSLAGNVAVLDALCKRASLDKTLMDMGYEPDPGYIERTYGTGWRRKPDAPLLDAVPAPVAPDPTLALAAVVGRMADIVETQAIVVQSALNAPLAPIEVNVAAPIVQVPAPVIQNDITVQPATVDLSVTATLPARQTITEVQRDARTGDITQTIQTERDAPQA